MNLRETVQRRFRLLESFALIMGGLLYVILISKLQVVCGKDLMV